jgi:peptidyl-dipeptidase A
MRTRSPILAALLAGALVACGGGSTSTTPGVTPAPIDPGAPASATEPAAPSGPTAEEARGFTAEVDRELRRLYVEQSRAEWAKQTDITPDHEAAAATASEALMSYLTTAIKASRKFDPIMDRLDPDTRRQIHLLRIAGTPAPDDPAKAAELARLTTEMDATYGKTKACDARGPTVSGGAAPAKSGGKCRDLGQLEDVLAKSRKPAELLAAWQGWHDAAGHAIKPMYEQFVPLANEGARGVGFANVGEMWRSGYDMTPDQFSAEVDRLWGQVEPLYQELHCYARRKLNKRYGDKVVPKTGPVPAHVFGNMWSQTWGYIYPELEPYKGVAQLDVSPALVKQKYDAIKMVRLAEAFFTSLGFDPLPETFWQRSMFVKPKDKEVVCHASAWDVEFENDLRIKMCIKPNHEDLATIHHELGHNYYFNKYYTLPTVYQTGANDGFHEAIGDTITLSMTPTYLNKVGLLGKVVSNDKAVINKQMDVALDKIAFLPWGLLVDQWRWDVFAGKVKPEDYNSHWWALRLRYQGIVPPVERTAADFDPGAKYHVPANVPYTRYFLSTVLQFQFHRALCQKAGQTGPLHLCSIHGSKEAGEALQAMLALGASKPWPVALEAMTGERQMDAGALLEYFAPLRTWLEEQNKGQTCGW